MKIFQKTNVLDGNADVFETDTECAEYYFSNNDGGIKKIAVLLKDKENLVLDGQGHTVIFHGRISPFILDNCKNVVIRNLNVRYDRPFYTQGTILRADKRSFDLQIDEGFNYRVENGDLHVFGKYWDNDCKKCYILFQEFDRNKKTLAPDADVMLGRIGKGAVKDPRSPMPLTLFLAEELGDRVVRLTADTDLHFRAGNAIVLTHETRENNIFSITNSKNVRLENICISDGGSMGIMAQLSENLMMKNISIRLEADSPKLVTTNCDAAHFVACSGSLEFHDCVFENMMDDGINVHGIYAEVVEKQGNEIVLLLKHFQHFSVNFFPENSVLNFYRGHTAEIIGRAKVLSSQMESESRIRLCLNHAEGIDLGCFAENASFQPDVTIERCSFGNNRPRGVLVTSKGRVCIDACRFYDAGYGIHIAGDTRFWYESSGVENLTIQNCKFIDCGVQNTPYSIAILPEYEPSAEAPFFHRNISIRENTFYSFNEGLVIANGVSHLKISGNKFIASTTYPKRSAPDHYVLQNCGDAEVSE